MRLATQNCGPVEVGGMVLGVNLGFDFCAEHEWGFKWASRYLGRPGTATRDLLGVAVRTTTKRDPDFRIELAEIGDTLWMRGQPAYYSKTTLAEDIGDPKLRSHALDSMVRWGGEKPLRAAWDGDSGFCVAAKADEAKAAVKIAHGALIGDRCFINQGGGAIFGAGGLCLIDAQLIPDGVNVGMRAADTSALNLKDLVEATGIRERLEEAGLRYFALSPKWIDEAKGAYHFWLNPMEQHRVNYGWFVLADLEAWIEGNGRIPMTAKQRAGVRA